ncbi:nose resistant to fluoxetine protein 6-like [Elysia marginata]|uniref:Nose resistant to fluoxetine protein 6-like n=1 Tax=Elysia marginata TaxID=1093978 RepID=A0AAV4JI95_9GAST|nr:nose resistant to fluoxetine protein 6-like [Elysia marginata]
MPRLTNRWTGDVMTNNSVSVDTFFVISGLLTAYLTVKEMNQKGWRLDWGVFYFHRLWRLTPPYMMTLVIILGIKQYCGEGPLWSPVQPHDKHNCEKHWWANLLYINNFVYQKTPCFQFTWYMAVAMQFFAVSPLMIIPFYFKELLGFVVCGILFAVHVIITGVFSAQNDWATSLTSAFNRDTDVDYLRKYYGLPWYRIGPYIIGIVVGYLLATYRDKIRLTWVSSR